MLLLVAVTLAVTLSGQPAAAAAPVTIAYAQRAQTWKLVLTNGDVVEVPEALAVAPDDVVNAGALAAFLVSGDGRHFFYFRKSDGRFVERTLNGKERVVSRQFTKASIYEEWPWVSDDGSYVVTGTSAPGMGVFADLRKGKVLPHPDGTDEWGFVGFSPDGNRLLLAGKQLTVFDRGLRAQIRLKTRLFPTALANDYVTAAVPVRHGSQVPPTAPAQPAYRPRERHGDRAVATRAIHRRPRLRQGGTRDRPIEDRDGGGDLPGLEGDRQGDTTADDCQA